VILAWWLGYGLDDWGSIPGRSRDLFLFASVSRADVGPTQPPVKSVSEAISRGLKQPGHEADYSPPPGAEVNVWSYTSTPLYVFMAWYFFKPQDNFNFTCIKWHYDILKYQGCLIFNCVHNKVFSKERKNCQMLETKKERESMQAVEAVTWQGTSIVWIVK
jgi:hypothetical protein